MKEMKELFQVALYALITPFVMTIAGYTLDKVWGAYLLTFAFLGFVLMLFGKDGTTRALKVEKALHEQIEKIEDRLRSLEK